MPTSRDWSSYKKGIKHKETRQEEGDAEMQREIEFCCHKTRNTRDHEKLEET